MAKSGLRRRLLESHLLIAFAGIVFVLVLFVSSSFLGRAANRLSDSISLIPHSVLSLIHGLQSSIAANHGWVTIGNHEFIKNNELAWQQIDSALIELEKTQQQNETLLSTEVLEEIKANIEILRDLQSGISFVSENSKAPATDRYDEEIAPLKLTITSMIERMNILNFDNADSLLGKSLENIEKHFVQSFLQFELLIKSNESLEDSDYNNSRTELLLGLTSLQTINTSSKIEITTLVVQISEVIRRYSELADQILFAHQEAISSQVREFLFERAVPLSNSVLSQLQQLEDSITAEVMQRRDEVSEITNFTLTSAFIALIGLVLSAVVISINNANLMINRLSSLSRALESFATQNRSEKIPIEGDDEISSLSRHFNHMVEAIEEKQSALRDYQNELEHRVERRTVELFQSKELAETTLRSIGDALITVDAEQKITMFNHAAEKLLQTPAKEVLGLPVTNVLIFTGSEHDKSEIFEPVQTCIDTGKTFTPDETLILHRSASDQISVKFNAAPIAGKNGSIDGAIVIVRDVTQEILMQKELSYQANHDVLTGLKSRSRFNRELSHLLQQNTSSEVSNVVAFLDLDNFKTVNDTAGHAAGDELLRQLARELKENIRLEDLIARLGGDEFGIVFHQCKIEHAVKVCNNLRDRVADYRFVWDKKTFKVGVSIGLVEFSGSSTTVSEILAQADTACYAAKQAGRNTVRVANKSTVGNESDTQPTNHNRRILRAIEKRQFKVLFHEFTSMIDSGTALCTEAAISILDEAGKVIPRSVYMPIVERYKQSTVLDLLTIESIFTAISKHAYANKNDLAPVFIRVSASSITSDEFISYVEKSISDSSLPHGVIHFSISENFLIENLSFARQLIDRWFDLGIEFVLDDFGGNLASFRFLKSLPIKYLRIDQCFTDYLREDQMNRSLVKAICELAHLSGKQTIAVVTKNHSSVEILRNLGVDIILDKTAADVLDNQQSDRFNLIDIEQAS